LQLLLERGAGTEGLLGERRERPGGARDARRLRGEQRLADCGCMRWNAAADLSHSGRVVPAGTQLVPEYDVGPAEKCQMHQLPGTQVQSLQRRPCGESPRVWWRL